MQIEELIRELRKYPLNLEVWIQDYEMNDVDPVLAEHLNPQMITQRGTRWRPEIGDDGEKRVLVLN